MQANFPDLEVLVSGDAPIEEMPSLPTRPVFDAALMSFLAEFSDALRKAPAAREYPDIMAFAFFIRNAQLKRFASDYADICDSSVGRGVTFHIAPSNVPINFAYSLVAGLLSGNSCIVRVSSKDFPQVAIVIDVLRDLLRESQHQSLANYIVVVRYGHNLEINRFLSSVCDVRVIWGGDSTISSIRQAPLPPKSGEMVFSDRYSALVIEASEYLAIADKERVANSFFNDTYLFDQGACSSPRLVYWVGEPETVRQAQEQFWESVIQVVDRKDYQNEPVIAVGKYVTMCRAAINTGVATQVPTSDNRVARVALESLDIELSEYDCVGGLFFEYVDSDIKQLATAINRKFQTLTYLGFDAADLRRGLVKQGVSGVDRIVPIGDAGVFSLVWDGYDVIRYMSRIISTS